VYDDTEASVSFSFVAFSSSLTHGRDLSQFWVADSVSSINLTVFQRDLVCFDPPPGSSRVDGVGVDVMGSVTF
jgi:hypothetical protein